MKPISAETVEKTWQRIADLSARQGENLAKRFANEQPLIVAYLMAVDTDLLNLEERELLFYVGTVVWQIMSQGDQPLPQVTETMLETAEETNRKALESLSEASEEDSRIAMEKILQEYAQPEVFKYVIEALMEAAQEEEARQDNLGSIMVDLKTLIDCLNR